MPDTPTTPRELVVDFHITPAASGSRLTLAGMDISRWTQRVVVEAPVGDVSTVTLRLVNVRVKLRGQVGALVLERWWPPRAPWWKRLPGRRPKRMTDVAIEEGA